MEGLVKHYSESDWVDFARGVVTAEQGEAMQKHLNEDCDACKRTVQLWTSVADFAKQETAYDPPSDRVRVVQSFLAPFKLGLRESQRLHLGHLTFDSLNQHVLQGMRGSDATTRQLMYQFGPLFVDMRLEPRPDSSIMALTGQVVDSREPLGGMAGIPVSIIGSGDTLSETVTNPLGEFRFDLHSSGHLRLLLRLDEGTLLLVVRDLEHVST